MGNERAEKRIDCFELPRQIDRRRKLLILILYCVIFGQKKYIA